MKVSRTVVDKKMTSAVERLLCYRTLWDGCRRLCALIIVRWWWQLQSKLELLLAIATPFSVRIWRCMASANTLFQDCWYRNNMITWVSVVSSSVQQIMIQSYSESDETRCFCKIRQVNDGLSCGSHEVWISGRITWKRSCWKSFLTGRSCVWGCCGRQGEIHKNVTACLQDNLPEVSQNVISQRLSVPAWQSALACLLLLVWQ
jgi:hypothetical protein